MKRGKYLNDKKYVMKMYILKSSVYKVYAGHLFYIILNKIAIGRVGFLTMGQKLVVYPSTFQPVLAQASICCIVYTN